MQLKDVTQVRSNSEQFFVWKFESYSYYLHKKYLLYFKHFTEQPQPHCDGMFSHFLRIHTADLWIWNLTTLSQLSRTTASAQYVSIRQAVKQLLATRITSESAELCFKTNFCAQFTSAPSEEPTVKVMWDTNHRWQSSEEKSFSH